jgi:hypothetical protein
MTTVNQARIKMTKLEENTRINQRQPTTKATQELEPSQPSEKQNHNHVLQTIYNTLVKQNQTMRYKQFTIH